MNSPSKNPSILKTALISAGFLSVISILFDLVASSFTFHHLLQLDYLFYKIGLEALIAFLASAGTAFVTPKLPDFTFGTVIIRVFTYCSFYIVGFLLLSFALYLTISGSHLTFNKTSLGIFLGGIKDSFVFMVVWMVLKYRQTT
ncbi:MAG: hypothetical protein K0S23_1013 [Fluviicola sp.]|jgi:hypothetical protein|uniref:hypothetical protein n=1 Tax=Fluviicola sp. TaxID=1917219 RepID=UPI002630E647|nr:hypothetical protein [Fluviicola sp.]MDF3026706.1 hypothetical protein [Fluviicola sp.]